MCYLALDINTFSHYSPDAFPPLIKLAENNNGEMIREKLGKALSSKDEYNNSGLDYIRDKIPNVLASLFKLGGRK